MLDRIRAADYYLFTNEKHNFLSRSVCERVPLVNINNNYCPLGNACRLELSSQINRFGYVIDTKYVQHLHVSELFS